MAAWLCEAGEQLRLQIDRRWPDRSKASDGWIGDASHTTGDHVPDSSSNPPGVVRAIDVDEDFHGGKPGELDPDVANRFANQLIEYARKGRDNGRLEYVIFEAKIASGTYPNAYWTWRNFSGDPHTTHLHVSFSRKGDHGGGKFDLPIFTEQRRNRLTRMIHGLRNRIQKLRKRRRSLR